MLEIIACTWQMYYSTYSRLGRCRVARHLLFYVPLGKLIRESIYIAGLLAMLSRLYRYSSNAIMFISNLKNTSFSKNTAIRHK